MHFSLLMHSIRGRREHQKVGGAPVSRGTFRMKRALKIFFPEMLATGENAEMLALIKGH